MGDMSKRIIGKPDGGNLRVAIVVSRFNDFITSRLVAGARDALTRHNVADERITEIQVPGVWEMPPVVAQLAAAGKHDAIVCLGCVIRGQTSHHLYVAGEGLKGIANVAASAGIAVGLGVLTTDTVEQAVDRAGAKAGNKGADAALAALETANLLRQLRAEP